MQLTRDELSQLRLVQKSQKTHHKPAFNADLLKLLEKKRLLRLTDAGPRLTPDGERELRNQDDD